MLGNSEIAVGFHLTGDGNGLFCKEDEFRLKCLLRMKYGFEDTDSSTGLSQARGAVKGIKMVVTFPHDGFSGHYVRYDKRSERRPLGKLAKFADLPGWENVQSLDEIDRMMQPDAVYDYYDEMAETIIASKVRFFSKDGGAKSIIWTHRCGGGEYDDYKSIIDLESDNCGCGRVQVTLYGLPELYDSQPGDLVFFTEGEKDANSLKKLGFTAICHASGSSHPWKYVLPRKVRNYLKRRHIVVVEDNDISGRTYCNWLINYLVTEVGCLSLKKVCLRKYSDNISDGSDVTDFIDFIRYRKNHRESLTDDQLRRIVLGIVAQISDMKPLIAELNDMGSYQASYDFKDMSASEVIDVFDKKL